MRATLVAILSISSWSAGARADDELLWELSFALRDDDDHAAIEAAAILRDDTSSSLHRATFACLGLLLIDRARVAAAGEPAHRGVLRGQRSNIDRTLQAARHCALRAADGPPRLRLQAPRLEGLNGELEATSAGIDEALTRPGMHREVLTDASRPLLDTSPEAVDALLASAGVPGAAPWFPETAALMSLPAAAALLVFLLDALLLLADPDNDMIPFLTGHGLSLIGPVMLAASLWAVPEIWLTVVASVAIAITGGALGVLALAGEGDAVWFAGGALIGVGVSLPILAVGIYGAANRASHKERIEEFLAREREGAWN